MVADLMKTRLDFEITDAKKSKGGYKLRPITELEFLKRVPVKKNGQWFGALLMESIDKTLNWGYCKTKRYPWEVREGEIIVTEGYDSTAIDLLTECAIHSKDFFERMRKHLLTVFEMLGITVPLPTWGEKMATLWHPLE